MRSADIRAWAVIVAVSVVVLWPMLMHGYPANSYDVNFHHLYAEEFAREIRAGNLFPRWLSGLNDSLGAPIFYFYGPLPYWLTSAVALLTGADHGLFLLGGATFFMVAGSGLAAFVWLRLWLPRGVAVAGACIYVALPYHILIDIWTRGAFAETAAYLWLPLIFRGVEDIRAGRRSGVALLALSLALLVVTHLITALLTCMVLGAYVLLRLRTVRTLLLAILGGATGLALAAAYLLPMLALRHAITLDVGFLDDWAFLLDAWVKGYKPDRAIWTAMNLVVAAQILAIAGLTTSLFLLRRRAEVASIGLLWGGLTLVVLFFTTIWSAPLWRLLPLLQNVQYPSRLLVLADLGTATCAAVLLEILRRRFPVSRFLPVAAVLGAALLGVMQAVPALVFANFDASRKPWDLIDTVRSNYATFRPVQSFNRLPFDEDLSRRASVSRAEVVGAPGRAEVEAWATGTILLRAELPQAATIRVAQLYFPTWSATAGTTQLQVSPSPEMGLVDIAVPEGATRILLSIAPHWSERIGTAVSALALLGWLGLLAWAARGARGPR